MWQFLFLGVGLLILFLTDTILGWIILGAVGVIWLVHILVALWQNREYLDYDQLPPK
jgi:hypothetical protein